MSRAPSPYLDGLLQLNVRVSGVDIATTPIVNLSSAFSASWNDTTKAVDVGVTDGAGVTSAAVVAALAGQTIAPGTVNSTAGVYAVEALSSLFGVAIQGTLSDSAAATAAAALSDGFLIYVSSDDGHLKAMSKAGRASVISDSVTRSATTTGGGSATLLTFLVPDNSIVAIDARINAHNTALHAYWGLQVCAGGISVESGSMIEIPGIMDGSGGTFGLPCHTSSAWSVGVVTTTVTGPSATITGTADNGAGKVRVECADDVLTAEINGRTMDISGVVGTTEANGTNLAVTWIDDTHFDIPSVVFANAWVSGGTVVLHSAPVVHWVGKITLGAAAS